MESRSEEGEGESFMELLGSDSFLCFGSAATDDHHGACKKSAASDSYSNASIITDEVTAEEHRRKKQKRRGLASLGTIKVRKDNLGDKIAALQQLVSPFGKSDTASVLQEALGYIRFLHDQVQVLSSPYLLQRLPTTASLHQDGETRGGDLRSRGLCLVPISCTEEVANDHQNGADIWSPPAGSSGSFSSAKH